MSEPTCYPPDLDAIYAPATLNVLRMAADLTLMFTVCGRLRCRRARACRGQPLACLMRYSPAVDADTRQCMARLTEAHRDGLDFDDAAHELAAEFTDLAAWWASMAARWREPAQIGRLPPERLRAFYRGLDQVPGGLPPLPCWDE
jgi:hypothetical protein